MLICFRELGGGTGVGALKLTTVEQGPSSLHRREKAQRQAEDSKAGSHVGNSLYLFLIFLSLLASVCLLNGTHMSQGQR